MGTSIANAIDLGSNQTVIKTGDSSDYPDTALSFCADPDDFGVNATKGDGGDVVSGAASQAGARLGLGRNVVQSLLEFCATCKLL